MKREELRNKLTDILSAAMSGGINFTQAERSIWDLFNPGLPPAEGAEEQKILTDFAEKLNTAMVNNDPEFVQIVNDHYFDLIDQPTAEGAEEILEKHLNLQFKDTPEDWTVALIQFNQEKFIAAMQEFATLHAQRLAEKMVEEKLRGERYIALLDFQTWLNNEQLGNIPDLWVDEYNKYLKTRER